MRRERLFFVEKIICSKDYSLKEQTWLATYAVRCPRSEEVKPAEFILTFNTISKRQALPCLFIYDFHPISHAGVKGQTNIACTIFHTH